MPKSHNLVDYLPSVFQVIMRASGTLKIHCTIPQIAQQKLHLVQQQIIPELPITLKNIKKGIARPRRPLVLHNLAVPALVYTAEKLLGSSQRLHKVILHYWVFLILQPLCPMQG